MSEKEFGVVYMVAKENWDNNREIAESMLRNMVLRDITRVGYKPTNELQIEEHRYYKIVEHQETQEVPREDANTIEMAIKATVTPIQPIL